jgi:hypothetical protein
VTFHVTLFERISYRDQDQLPVHGSYISSNTTENKPLFNCKYDCIALDSRSATRSIIPSTLLMDEEGMQNVLVRVRFFNPLSQRNTCANSPFQILGITLASFRSSDRASCAMDWIFSHSTRFLTSLCVLFFLSGPPQIYAYNFV